MSADELFNELYADVMAKARANSVSRCETMKVFLGAYQEHKDMPEHGSFKHHPEYDKAMSGRYRFMHDKAIKYIEAHKR